MLTAQRRRLTAQRRMLTTQLRRPPLRG